MKTIKSELSYNNSRYGKGKAWLAKLNGVGGKFGFDRKFLDRDIDYRSTAKTTWYSYSWVVEDEGVYELHEENSFKKERRYFIYIDGEWREITKDEAIEALENGLDSFREEKEEEEKGEVATYNATWEVWGEGENHLNVFVADENGVGHDSLDGVFTNETPEEFARYLLEKNLYNIVEEGDGYYIVERIEDEEGYPIEKLKGW